MAANLRRPAGLECAPLVLLIPGLDSTKEEFFHWENVFLARGMATLSMDGPGQGETGFTLPIRADYEVAVAALLDDLSARAEPRIDLTRVGAAGVSLGGYYAPRAAAFEPRIRAVAAISGPYDFGEIWEQLPPLTREAFTVFGTRPPASDERDARGAGRATQPERRGRADHAAGALCDRRARPDRSVGADRTGGARDAERVVRALRAGVARVQQPALSLPAAGG